MEIGIVNHVPNFNDFSRGHLHCRKLFIAVRWIDLKNTAIFINLHYIVNFLQPGTHGTGQVPDNHTVLILT